MRIRKHARYSAPSLSPPSSTAPGSPDTHVCELNRSPWDVLAFTQEFEHQVKIEDEYACYSDERNPLYASNSIACNKEAPCAMKKGKTKIGGKKKFNYIRCGKIDGKGWQCKKEVKQGELLCEHHLLQLETYKHKYNYSYTSRKAKEVESKTKTVASANKKRNKGRISSASPADFYFYSGFGPSWGKNRGNGNAGEEDKIIIDAADQRSSSSTSAAQNSDNGVHDQANHGTVDLVVDDFFSDDDDENEDGDEKGGKKRIRKPIKARSLKSLF